MSILIVSLQGIGNTLMMLYAAEKLRDRTSAGISFVVSNNGSQELALSQVSGNNVYIWDESKSSLGNVARLFREIRKTCFDEVYLAYPSWKREGVIGLLARSGKKKVVLDSGSTPALFKYLFNTRIRKSLRIHDINTNYLLFKVPNDGYLRSGMSLVETVMAHHADFAVKYFTENNLLDKFVVALHPGSKGERKRWDPRKFIQLGKELNERFGCSFIVVGGEDELLLKHAIAHGIGIHAVVLNSPNLFQTASVLSKCNLFIGNDSAPMHLSMVMGTPIVALWSYSDFYRTSPYGPGNIIVRSSTPDSPFQKTVEYMKDLQVEHVLPVVSRIVEIIKSNKRNAGEIDMDLRGIAGVDNTFRLEHGCTVVEFKS